MYYLKSKDVVKRYSLSQLLREFCFLIGSVSEFASNGPEFKYISCTLRWR